MFDDEFYTVPFMKEVRIPQNWTYLVQSSSQSDATDNIDLGDNWFIQYLEEHPIENPSHVLRVAPENNRNMLMMLQSVLQVQEIPVRE